MTENIQNTVVDIMETTENTEKLPRLRPKLRNCIESVLSGENYAVAHKNAGFKAKNEQARYQAVCDYLNIPIVRQYVSIRDKQIQALIQANTQVTIERTLKELARLGYSNAKNLLDDNGNMKAVKDLDEDTARAIASIEVEQRKDGTVTKVKLWNKNDALKSIATYLGMLVERKDIRELVSVKINYGTDEKSVLPVSKVDSIIETVPSEIS